MSFIDIKDFCRWSWFTILHYDYVMIYQNVILEVNTINSENTLNAGFKSISNQVYQWKMKFNPASRK